MNGESCVRRRVEINGENYYLTVGRTFVTATVPHENRPDRENERLVVETLCAAISEVMESQGNEKEQIQQ